MSFDIQVESYEVLKSEGMPLMLEHYEEISLHKEKSGLEPNFSRYEAMNAENALCCITVRQDGELIGYHVSIICPHLHYKNVKIAVTDVPFISKRHRNGMLGARLFMFFEREMKRRGVQELVGGTKLSHDIGKLFEYLGWKQTDALYSKWIGE